MPDRYLLRAVFCILMSSMGVSRGQQVTILSSCSLMISRRHMMVGIFLLMKVFKISLYFSTASFLSSYDWLHTSLYLTLPMMYEMTR